MKEQLDKAIKAKRQEQEMKYYYKTQFELRKSQSKDNQDSEMRSLLEEKENGIKILENEKAMLEERIDHFIDSEVSTLKNVQYTDEVREVYQDLMRPGVGAKKVETIVRKVLGMALMQEGFQKKPLLSTCFLRLGTSLSFK